MYELLTVLVTAFVLNLIPFAGPSNLLIAYNAAILTKIDPLLIGGLVAFGAATAKLIHYLFSFFIGSHLGKERRKRLDATASKVRRWAFLALFVAAATPIPDEPVVIPLGLLKYNPVKFYVAFLAGKLSITIVGAYLGIASRGFLEQMMNPTLLIIVSVVLTIVITIVLLKIDVGKIANRVLKRSQAPEKNKEKQA